MAPLVYLFEDDDSLRDLLAEVLRDELACDVELCASIALVHERCAARTPT